MNLTSFRTLGRPSPQAQWSQHPRQYRDQIT
jgi:hypothetical protein